ncbi:MAG: hypothetical protein F4Y18_05355 [Cenarchaeum sp. SB0663_bin_5]|nr:hypothetical protein [Cenarchaeum sp. SB0663_bin_5]MYH04157.1 hypothetical protein [Cenarchaeum sp. SB0675_bin_21]
MVGGSPDRGLHNGHLNVLQLPLPHMTRRDHANREGGDAYIRPRQDDHADTERGNVRNDIAAAAMGRKQESGLYGGLMRHGSETGTLRPTYHATIPIVVPTRTPARACSMTRPPGWAVGQRSSVRERAGTGSVDHWHHTLMQRNSLDNGPGGI